MSAYKSKTAATWLAFLGGGVGLHRFYLFGLRDPLGWLWMLPTALGVHGFWRAVHLGQDDQLAWALVPLLGVSLAAGMLAAIVYGLMPDEKWNARFNPEGRQHTAGWSTVIGVVLSLFIGATVLMATIAFGSQRFFEYQIDEAHKISR
jgi:hypothetical protein